MKMKNVKLLPIALVLLLAACRAPASPTQSSTICGSPIPQYSDRITIRRVHIQGKSEVAFRGESALPDGTCILTQLCEDDLPLAWWPADRCALVKDGRWEIQVRMSEVEEAPDVLSDTAMYILRAWQRDNPAVEAQYFPFDLQGPPPESTPSTPAPMASLPAPTKTSALPEMFLTISAPASPPGPTPTATPDQSLDTEIVFTIVNEEPFSGREGDPKPDWLAWGAQAFTVAPDGSFWIADSAADPPRLLHYSPNGALLKKVSLEGLVVGLADVTMDGDNVLALSIASMPPKVLQFSMDGTYQGSHDWSNGLHSREFVAPDGSYYMDQFEMEPGPVVQGKRLIRYYSAQGVLVGELELPEPAVYAQHDLALGSDGILYYMISRADHSVEIWRLSFGGDPFPVETKISTPSPESLSPLLPAWETPPPGASDLAIARQTLIRFFTFLHYGRYGDAASLYGGSYTDLPNARDDLLPTSEDKALVWKSECQLLQCLLVSRVAEETQVSPDEFVFVVEFMNEDGTLFVLGPAAAPRKPRCPRSGNSRIRSQGSTGSFR
jgi:hypothetical protein